MTLYRDRDYGKYLITELLTTRIKDYSFDTYVEYFLKTFPFLDKIASTTIERLTQEPGFSEASEDEKILEFLPYAVPFWQFPSISDIPSSEYSIAVCSSDLFDIVQKITGTSYTETEETRAFLVLAPKCHNLRDAFYFFTDLQG